ncbi:SHNi-TPR domain-containing protein [Aspergillus tanneri]|uniref:Tetratricopeptide SHNi-TPR domain-containing protein n=1 Tax=Aspergillus tanneri TaxID=1220188 RepID=A0A5M9MVR8_9EURO|nr:uncharacterized protein ATNIH1004_002696 [Aspergillus tanneri]KAA8650016.1 hypothetical protein ATNIH1004_002696 [Aspergillus tanneri]
MADGNPNKADAKSSEAAVEASQVYLEKLIERAAAKDAIRDFDSAAEIYSEATELQAKLNGELSLDNADLLFSYGKALYNVAISKSDVLGSKVAGETQSQSQSEPAQVELSSGPTSTGDNLIQDAVTRGLASKEPLQGGTLPVQAKNKPFFQFSGDENFDDSDTEGDEDDKETAGVDEDEDDFANAFEVLDLARILYHKKLTAIDDASGKGKSAALPSIIRHIKERLADTYDLQAEISLEAERFVDAIADLRAALDLRQTLFSVEHPSVAECHYKLSLALEFGSVQRRNDNSESDNNSQRQFDEQMRKDAATQMEKAIESCRIRMSQEQKKLNSENSLDEDKGAAMRRRIANVKDIIADMEQRLIDLRHQPVSLEDSDGENEAVLKGILGQIMGQSPAEQKDRLETVTKEANDLSAFVKRKPTGKQSSQVTDLPHMHKRAAPEVIREDDAKRIRTDSTTNNRQRE